MVKPFGPWVRDLREARLNAGDPAFSLRRFAAACDLSPTFVSRLERDEFDPPSAEKLVTMVDVLGVDRWEFFRRAGRPDPDLTDLVHAPSRGMWRLLGLLRDGGYSEGDCEEMIRWLIERRASAGMVTEERGQAGWSRRKGGPGVAKAGAK